MSQRQTRSQRMARLALDCVKPAAAGAMAKDYRSRAMGFPTQVLQSGLAQAVGFLSAKRGDANSKAKAYRQYLDDLAKVAGRHNGSVLLEDALKTDLAGYRLLTREVLDASSWLKRFSQSLIKDDGKEAPNGA